MKGVLHPLFKSKIVRIMRLTVLFLLLGLMQLAASTYSQTAKLNLNLHNKSVKEVLQSIENQSKFRFAYSSEFIDMERKVNIKMEDQTIEEILKQVFKGTNVKHEVEDRHILLYSTKQETTKQQKSIKGTVKDTSGQPLPGVSIIVKGTTNGTVTDFDGNFSLSNVSDDETLIFSFVGMRTQEIAVNGQAVFSITMAEDAIGIEEIVAVGYGIQKKANLTGSVATVKSEDLIKAPVGNASEILTGRVPGLIVKQDGGQPGNDDAKIKIRGFNAPLVLVDGVEMSFDRLDPNDIESISVLKDAAAAIYGSRAGNGVILVTTKGELKENPQSGIMVM